jgi:hypothetical protein
MEPLLARCDNTVPRYDEGRGDDCLEGEVGTPTVLIEHAAEVASELELEPEPVASSPMEALSVVPEPESAAARYERERIDAWIRNRLIAYPLACCLLCRKPIIAGQDWQEASNGEARARFHRTCHAEWRTEREARRDRRWGSRADPFRTERSRRMRGADVARVARSPPSAAVGRAFVRAICAAAAGCTTTPSTLMPKLIDHESNAEPSNKG